MADAGRLTPHNKPNQNGDASDGQRKHVADAEKPALKVTFERNETREALKSEALKSTDKSPSHVVLVPEPAPAKSYGSEGTTAAKDGNARSGLGISLLEKPEAPKAAEAKAPEQPRTETREIPSAPQLLATPLLAIVAALATLGAGWSYMKLNETRQQLAAASAAIESAAVEKVAATQAKVTAQKAIESAQAQMTTATQVKASAEKALTDAQSRLTSLETTVSEVKAALAAIIANAKPADAAPARPAAPTPAK